MQNNHLTKKERRTLRRESILCVLFPHRCPFCGRVMGFSPDCNAPYCVKKRHMEELTPKRLEHTSYYLPDIEGAAAVYRYTSTPRHAVLQLKYYHMRTSGRILGNLMAQSLFGATFSRYWGMLIPNRLPISAPYHMIVPVPPSNAARGYNVPDLLAESLHHALGIPVRTDLLHRARFTKHQAGLPLEERFANVAGAFSLQTPQDLTGQNILLVDDVITTGATVSACAQALLKAGAESIFVMTFAATASDVKPKEKPSPI